MNQNQTIQLIIFLLIAGSGVLRWLLQKLQEQAAEKRRRDELERRQQEALRTGRDPVRIVVVEPSGDDERARRQAQEAARRQAQIEEFRRRQQERARQRLETIPGRGVPPTRSTASPPPIVVIPGSTGPTVPQPARSRQQRTPVQSKRRPQPAPPPAPEPPRRREPVVAPPLRPVESPSVGRLGTPAQRDPSAPKAETFAILTPPRSPQEWRRAILLTEILSPPVADRLPGAPGPF